MDVSGQIHATGDICTDQGGGVCLGDEGMRNELYFGGMYGEPSASYTNPLTGSKSCPAGYTSKQVLGTPGTDYDLYFCYR